MILVNLMLTELLLETAMLFTPFTFHTPEHQIRVQHNGVERTATIVDDSYSRWRDAMHIACNGQGVYFAPVCHNTVSVLPVLTQIVYLPMAVQYPDCLRTAMYAVVPTSDWWWEGWTLIIHGGIRREELAGILFRGWSLVFAVATGSLPGAYPEKGCLE